MKSDTKEMYKTGGIAAGFFIGVIIILALCAVGFFGAYDWLYSFKIFSGQRLENLCFAIAFAFGGAILMLFALKIAADVTRKQS